MKQTAMGSRNKALLEERIRARMTELEGYLKNHRDDLQFHRAPDPCDLGAELVAVESETMLQQRKAEEYNCLRAKLMVLDKITGFCQDCGIEIPEARLEARPFTTHCVHCQAALDGTSYQMPDVAAVRA